ncbi:tyrosine-protein phosphatase [Microbacterium resistens]|uniref:tyrosine-protein phosphatase n=1 Tax=Microbacterium resistens TaxID=156977 RepID=UPI00366C3F28
MTVLDVPGAANVRDVGGIPAGASRIRQGMLLRSGHLSGLTAQGRAILRDRVRRVVDLRDDDEVRYQPSALVEVPVTRIPLFHGSVASLFVEDVSLPMMYRRLVDDAAARMVEVARLLADGEPTLVHCTAGKDRTGVSVALALSAVGADREAVIADYALTETLMPPEHVRMVAERLRAHHPDARHALALATASPAPVMRDLLVHVDERYGSAADYLLAAGLTRREFDALGAALVE